MERVSENQYSERRQKKSQPKCERCGRPVKFTIEDYENGSCICPSCAGDAKASRIRDLDFDGRI